MKFLVETFDHALTLYVLPAPDLRASFLAAFEDARRAGVFVSCWQEESATDPGQTGWAWRPVAGECAQSAQPTLRV